MGLDTERMASLLGFFSVSPACAGMIPAMMYCIYIVCGEPRMRGDDPLQSMCTSKKTQCAPHARG